MKFSKNTPKNFKTVIFFVGIPALWWSSFSLAEQRQTSELEFIPVAVHAFHTADYSIDTGEKFAPVDPDLLDDTQKDQKVVPPITPIASTPIPDPERTGDEDDQEGSESAPPQSTPDSSDVDTDAERNNGNGNSKGNSGNGNGGVGNGRGNGNKK